jgi:hypothetical protein
VACKKLNTQFLCEEDMKKRDFFSGLVGVFSFIIVIIFSAVPAYAQINECTASYDAQTNTVHVPCFSLDNQLFRVDMGVISFDPIQLQVHNIRVTVPKFVSTGYIELDKITRISKFRSSIGHDYSDDFESCRSMKHYFMPKSDINWSDIKIFSPVKGTVSKIYQEWAGTQVQISSEDYPNVLFTIFHINLSGPLNVGDVVSAGQQLGTHIGSQTLSDIAVSINTPEGRRLVSFFDIMTAAAFQGYQSRGLISPTDLILSKEARDSDPLNCNGQSFINSGTLVNWVNLD